MALYTPRPGSGSGAASFVLDTKSLASLKKGLSGTKEEEAVANAQVAEQFESLFIQLMLKQARQATPDSGLFSSDQTRLAQSLGDEQLALSLAQGGGMGIAQSLLEQLQGGDKTDPMHHRILSKSSRVDGLESKTALEKAGQSADPIGQLISLLDGKSAGAGIAALGKKALDTLAQAPERVASFINQIGDAAVKVAKNKGIHPELVLSQAALESGWGRREIRRPDGSSTHNIFGIKAGASWDGEVVHVTTTEYIDGKARKLSQPFRSYDSYEQALNDYARLISENDRYEKVLSASSAEQAAREVQKAGYATDPQYANKLIKIMAYFSG